MEKCCYIEYLFKDDSFQDLLSDEIRCTISRTVFRFYTEMVIFRVVNNYVDSKVKFTATICAEFQARKHSLLFCICRAAFVHSQLRHLFKGSSPNDCSIRIVGNRRLFLYGKNPFFSACGTSNIFLKYRMPEVTHTI